MFAGGVVALKVYHFLSNSIIIRMRCQNMRSGHMTFIQRHLNVDATSSRCIDVEATLYRRHMSAGCRVLINNINIPYLKFSHYYTLLEIPIQNSRWPQDCIPYYFPRATVKTILPAQQRVRVRFAFCKR